MACHESWTPVNRLTVQFASLNRFQQTFTMDNGQNMQLGGVDLVDQTIAVDKTLSDVLLAQFGDDSA